MRKLVLILALAMLPALGGCATFQKIETALSLATGPIVSPEQVYIAINAFDGVEATATNYLRLPRCPAAAACRNASTSAAVTAWIKAGRADRNKLKAGLRGAPGQNISLVDIYNDLQNITGQLGALVGH